MNLEYINKLGNKTEIAKLLGITTMTYLNWRARKVPKTGLQEKYVKLINYIIEKEGVDKFKEII